MTETEVTEISFKGKVLLLSEIPTSETFALSCPNCGAKPQDFEPGYPEMNIPDTSGSLIADVNYRECSIAEQINSGVSDGFDWTEVHRCQYCETIYQFENGNY